MKKLFLLLLIVSTTLLGVESLAGQNLLYEFNFDKWDSSEWRERVDGEGKKSVNDSIISIFVPKTAKKQSLSNMDIYTSKKFKYEKGKYAMLQMRLRLRNVEDKGQRGWGLWNREWSVKGSQPAYFRFLKGHPDPSQNGFMTKTSYQGKLKYSRVKENIALDQWHIYTIEWCEKYVKFWVDDVMVAEHTTGVPRGKMALLFWIDNSILVVRDFTHYDIDNPTYMDIDWVKVFKNDAPYSP